MTSSRSDRPTAADVAVQYLTFFVAGDEYAVSLEHVREVIPYDTVTRVPGMPATVRGATNVRGSVVPVVDLAIKFRLPEVPITGRTAIVLVEVTLDERSLMIGLLTEEVGQVLGLGEGELLAPPAFGTPIRTDFLKGMAAVGKKFALILDIERVLSPKELLSTEAVEARPEASEAADGEDAGWEIPTEAHKSSPQAAELTDPAS